MMQIMLIMNSIQIIKLLYYKLIREWYKMDGGVVSL